MAELHWLLSPEIYGDEIVQPYVIPFIQAQANNVTFQQDNARPHVARVVHDYLTQQNVDLLPWPAVSPMFGMKWKNGYAICQISQ